jgi:hypothetical protein
MYKKILITLALSVVTLASNENVILKNSLEKSSNFEKYEKSNRTMQIHDIKNIQDYSIETELKKSVKIDFIDNVTNINGIYFQENDKNTYPIIIQNNNCKIIGMASLLKSKRAEIEIIRNSCHNKEKYNYVVMDEKSIYGLELKRTVLDVPTNTLQTMYVLPASQEFKIINVRTK